MWKSCAQGKHKFFFWLLLKDRLNTRNLLKRKNRVLMTTIVFSANLEVKRLYCICSSSAPLDNTVGSPLAYYGISLWTGLI
uniref:Reverse transcriptase zinc-binding domain-containing protein n=1 Tax=Arundo donax TaxID=35708 RepID=A0A0A8ZD98_ARUDO